jgi:hypothetical protein
MPDNSEHSLMLNIVMDWGEHTILFFKSQRSLQNHVEKHYNNPNEDWLGFHTQLGLGLDTKTITDDMTRDGLSYRDCCQAIQQRMRKIGWAFSFIDRNHGFSRTYQAISPLGHLLLYTEDFLTTAFRNSLRNLKQVDFPTFPFHNGQFDWRGLSRLDPRIQEIIVHWIVEKVLRHVRSRCRSAYSIMKGGVIPPSNPIQDIRMDPRLQEIVYYGLSLKSWMAARDIFIQSNREI